MNSTCFKPPTFPNNKRMSSSSKLSSTYLSFRDPADEIPTFESAMLTLKADNAKRGGESKKTKKLSKCRHTKSLSGETMEICCKHAQKQNISIYEFNETAENTLQTFSNSNNNSLPRKKSISLFENANIYRYTPNFEFENIDNLIYNKKTSNFGGENKYLSDEQFQKSILAPKMDICDFKNDDDDFRNSNFNCYNTNNILDNNKNLRNSRKFTSNYSDVERKFSNTNSLRRSFRNSPKLSLSKWRSEGNLTQLKGNENSSLPSPASGKLDKCLKALSGSWKNLLQLGGMSRPPKATPQAKRVAPPAVPDVYRLSGSSFGSAGYASSEDGVFLTAPDTPNAIRDDHSDYGSTISSTGPGKSPGPSAGSGSYGQQQFTFPPPGTTPGMPLTHKAAVYYHHQLALQEDQGIDMTQSPGRDSPGSSSGSAGSGSRHSTASLDSGRASGYLGPPRGALGSAGSPRCSLSSCSLGSEHGRVERLLHQGAPDHDIIHAWLTDLQFEEYAPLFAAAGYDLPTITRMTPEDLTAIGIKKPNHRKRLKSEIAQLALPDNLPDYIPGSMEEWLRLLRLEEYAPALVSQGYQSVEDVTQLTWEDLEDIGIVRLGHQKKILLAIKRVKDIRAGKRLTPQTSLQQGSQPHLSGQGLQSGQDHSQCDMIEPLYATPPMHPGHVHAQRHAYQQPWEVQQSRQMNNINTIMSASCYYAGVPGQGSLAGPGIPNDIVPIKIRQGRGKSLESLEDTERSTHLTFCGGQDPNMSSLHGGLYTTGAQTCGVVPSGPGGIPGQTWRRSYDDGDITPTNEAAILGGGYEGGGTLPRPRGLVRPRPIAKITANTKREPNFQEIKFQEQQYAEYAQYNPKYSLYSPNLSKKIPPEVPKRLSSAHNENQYQTTVEIHTESIQKSNIGHDLSQKAGNLNLKSLPLSLPAYPSSDSLSCVSLESDNLPLPPPPAPCTPTTATSVSQRWAAGPMSSEEQQLINTLVASQARNGSDASFKSSSSTESDSLPFANENAGTIKQRANNGHHYSMHGNNQNADTSAGAAGSAAGSEPADVLSDIGNMLANLTDELDAMLEEEKRQGLTDQ